MKRKSIISGLLTAALAVGSIGVIPAMAEDSPVVYNYINDSGDTVNVTQADLDAGHWDKDLLGSVSHETYANFPMSIDKFVNDFGELSLDFVYMKKINDFTNVSITIENLSNGESVYSGEVTDNSFYSPVIDIDGTYLVTVQEEIDGNITESKRIVQTKKSTADMPEYVSTGSGDETILVSSLDDLAAVETKNDNGEIVIDNRINPYTSVAADEFDSYCSSLPENQSYRVYTTNNNEQYAGFFDGNDCDNIYDYNIVVSDYDALYSASTYSTPSRISLTDVKSRAYEIGFEDYAFKITDGSSDTSKYKSFMIDVTDYPLANIANYSNYYLKATIRGDVSLGVYLWLEVDGTSYPISVTAETGSTTRGISVDLKSSRYGITADSEVQLYGAIYFPTATVGYGMVTPELLQGYSDDVTGSVYKALHDTTTPSEVKTFKEYNTHGGLDVDVFYLKTISDCYKVSIRNRSVADQNKLDKGQMCTGSGEKYLYLYSAKYPSNSQATNSTNVLYISEDAVYAIPRNADISVYSYGSDNIYKMFAAVRAKSLYTISSSNYHISYEVWGGDDSVVEDFHC